MKTIASIIVLFFATVGMTLAQSSEAKEAFYRAEYLRKSKNFVSAIDQYNKASNLSPENPRIYYMKGLAYVGLADYENAILAFKQALAVKPDLIQAYMSISQGYTALSRPLLAIEYMDKASAYIKDPQEKLKLTEAIISKLVENNMFTQALEKINEAKGSFTEIPAEMYYLEAKLYNQKGDYSRGLEAAEQSILYLTEHHQHPESMAKYYFELGLAAQKLGRYDIARTALKKANHGPYKALIARMSPSYFIVSAQNYARLFDYEKSKDLLAESLKMDPNQASAYLLLAEINDQVADKSKSIDMYRKAILHTSNADESTRAYKSLATALIANKRYQEAAEQLDFYLTGNQDDYEGYFLLAVAEFHIGQYPNAVEALHMATSNAGMHAALKAQYHFLAGLAQAKMGNVDLAKTEFRKAAHGPFKLSAEYEYTQLSEPNILTANRQ